MARCVTVIRRITSEFSWELTDVIHVVYYRIPKIVEDKMAGDPSSHSHSNFPPRIIRIVNTIHFLCYHTTNNMMAINILMPYSLRSIISYCIIGNSFSFLGSGRQWFAWKLRAGNKLTVLYFTYYISVLILFFMSSLAITTMLHLNIEVMFYTANCFTKFLNVLS